MSPRIIPPKKTDIRKPPKLSSYCNSGRHGYECVMLSCGCECH